MALSRRCTVLFAVVILSFLSLLELRAQPSDPSYILVWSEEYAYPNGSQPSSSLWNWETGNEGGWGNEEQEYYTNSTANSYVEGGVLFIEAQYQQSYDNSGFDFTSARMTTQGKVLFYHGYVAARAMINMQNGFWPAIWALGNSSSTLGWPWCGEIDFMEQVNGATAASPNNDYTQFGTLHYNDFGKYNSTYNAVQDGGTVTSTTAMWGSQWHVYGFEWTSSAIVLSVDGSAYFSAQLDATVGFNSFTDPSNPFYLITNLAIGGTFPNQTPSPSSLPGYLQIDWIRIWLQNDGVSYVIAPPASSPSSSSAAPLSVSSSSSAPLPPSLSSSTTSAPMPPRWSSSSSAPALLSSSSAALLDFASSSCTAGSLPIGSSGGSSSSTACIPVVTSSSSSGSGGISNGAIAGAVIGGVVGVVVLSLMAVCTIGCFRRKKDGDSRMSKSSSSSQLSVEMAPPLPMRRPTVPPRSPKSPPPPIPTRSPRMPPTPRSSSPSSPTNDPNAHTVPIDPYA